MSSPKIKRLRLVRCSTANITSSGELDDGEGGASTDDYTHRGRELCKMICNLVVSSVLWNAMDACLFIDQVHLWALVESTAIMCAVMALTVTAGGY